MNNAYFAAERAHEECSMVTTRNGIFAGCHNHVDSEEYFKARPISISVICLQLMHVRQQWSNIINLCTGSSMSQKYLRPPHNARSTTSCMSLWLSVLAGDWQLCCLGSVPVHGPTGYTVHVQHDRSIMAVGQWMRSTLCLIGPMQFSFENCLRRAVLQCNDCTE